MYVLDLWPISTFDRLISSLALQEAEIFLVFATVDPSLGYKGITCFVVEKEQGVKVAKKEVKLGIRASSTWFVVRPFHFQGRDGPE